MILSPSICNRFHSPLTKYCVIILKNRNSRKSSNSRKWGTAVTIIYANTDYCILYYSKSGKFQLNATLLTDNLNFDRKFIFLSSYLTCGKLAIWSNKVRFTKIEIKPRIKVGGWENGFSVKIEIISQESRT